MCAGMWTMCPAAGISGAEPIGAALGAIGIVGRLEQVDVVVKRARMIGVARDDRLERREDCAPSPASAMPSFCQ